MKHAEIELGALERRVDRLERDVGDRYTGLDAQRERVEALEATLARVARVAETQPTGDLGEFVARLAAALTPPPKPARPIRTPSAARVAQGARQSHAAPSKEPR